MTNNPTIDGVSREDQRHAAVKALHDVMQSVPSASLYSLAEAVLDAGYAPAVERQEPDIYRVRVQDEPGDPDESPFTTYYLHAWTAKALKRTHGEYAEVTALYAETPEVTALQSTIAQLRIDLGNQTELTKQADYHASQRGNEITQLQARIEELESGRGEPVAWLHTMHFEEGFGYQSRITVSPENAFGKPGLNYDALFKVTPDPLFTAPPAPVAVVLPDRCIGAGFGRLDEYRQGWNACLDATAALNEGRK